MLPIRWDPVTELTNLRREMDDLFRRTLGSSWLEEAPAQALESSQLMSPAVETFVERNKFHIKAELPGVAKEDIDVSVDGNILTLKGERKEERERREKDYQLRETRYGSFVRRLTLPEGAKTDDIHASYDNGVLEISLPFDKKAISGRKVMIEGPETGKKGKKIH